MRLEPRLITLHQHTREMVQFPVQVRHPNPAFDLKLLLFPGFELGFGAAPRRIGVLVHGIAHKINDSAFWFPVGRFVEHAVGVESGPAVVLDKLRLQKMAPVDPHDLHLELHLHPIILDRVACDDTSKRVLDLQNDPEPRAVGVDVDAVG